MIHAVAGVVASVLAVYVPAAGLALALLGMAFAIGGAAIDTGFSAAYNLSQHMGWRWGKSRDLMRERRFGGALAAAFGIAFLIAATGIDPVELTEYAVVFSAVAMPLTFLPLVLTANDRNVMGQYANGPFAKILGWLFLGIACVVAVAAPVLLFVTNGGGG